LLKIYNIAQQCHCCPAYSNKPLLGLALILIIIEGLIIVEKLKLSKQGTSRLKVSADLIFVKD